ncbi:MAG: hypothetical protein IIC73_03490, partial [Armatimonadetes bacterium]|nr:hypothetical protein [Armatimonadota bacterium]
MSISKAKYTAKTASEAPASFWLDTTLLIWSVLVVLWAPFGLIHRLRRSLFRSKHDPYIRARWTAELQTPEVTAKLLQQKGQHVVLVSASLGELLITDKITRAIRADRPAAKVTWAIRDRQTLEHTKKMHPGQSVVYWPYDWIVPVVRWLKATRPDVLVMVERYRFPMFVRATRRYGAHVVLVNGRCKLRKFFFAAARPYFRWLFSSYSSVFFQHEEYVENARPLMGEGTNVAVTGDIKFDLSHIRIEPEKAVAVDQWISSAGDVPVLAVGSTDCEEEERFVIEAFLAVRKTRDVRLMIAPRRPARTDAVVKLLESHGLTVSRRSRMDGPADVYVLDTLGELSYAYKFATAAYVGGSLVGMGHNVIEPLEWGIPVSYGPNR